MSTVLHVRERPSPQRAAEWSLQGFSFVRTYVRYFQVQMSNPDPSDQVQVMQAVDPNNSSIFIPQYGSPMPGDSYSFVQDIQCRMTDAPATIMWEVTVSYSNQINPAINPLFAPPIMSWDKWETDMVIEQDFSTNGPDGGGVPIVNSAGVPFPGVTYHLALPELTYQVNIASYNALFLANYYNAINTDVFNGWPQFTVFCSNIAATQQIATVGIAQLEYWQVSFQFVFNPQTWIFNALDCGTLQLDETGKHLIPIVDNNGSPIQNPTLLDGNGKQVAQNLILIKGQNLSTTGGPPVYLPFQLNPGMPFSALGIVF